MENMFLKAASLGLGGLLIGCSLLCEKQINRLLGADKELMGVLVFGYPRRYTKQARKNNPRETTTLL
jgi:nitroreductase